MARKSRIFKYDKEKGEVVEIERPVYERKVDLYNYTSDALGVMPDQVEEARSRNRAIGLDLDYKPNGEAIITGKEQWRRAVKAQGLVDRSSYY